MPQRVLVAALLSNSAIRTQTNKLKTFFNILKINDTTQ